jgi:hypothetical protein
MKSLIQAVAVALVLSAPIASFAQDSNQPLTRAQVRAELAQAERAGYDPTDWMHYPQNAQTAQARIAEQNRTAQADTSGYGPSGHGSWQAGNSSDTTVSTYSPPVRNVR